LRNIDEPNEVIPLSSVKDYDKAGPFGASDDLQQCNKQEQTRTVRLFSPIDDYGGYARILRH
jgi:hypothetical protein